MIAGTGKLSLVRKKRRHVQHIHASRLVFSLLMLIGSMDVRAGAYDSGGILSNLLLDENRIIFMQNGGYLTALDADSGEVLVRRKVGGTSEWGDFIVVDEGILWRSSTPVLLDRESLSHMAGIPGLPGQISTVEFDGIVKSAEKRPPIEGIYFWEHNSSDRIDRAWLHRGKSNLQINYNSQPPTLLYEGATGRWAGSLPYLEDLAAITERDGTVYIGSDTGYVECIDLKEGQSRWLYGFAFCRYQDLPIWSPWWGEYAGAWHKRLRALHDSVGLVQIPESLFGREVVPWKDYKETFTGELILDPKAAEAYPYYRLIWWGAWLPLWGIVAAMLLGPRRGNKALRSTLLFVAWLTSVTGIIHVWLLLDRGSSPAQFTLVHTLIWGILSVAFGGVFLYWRIKVWKTLERLPR